MERAPENREKKKHYLYHMVPADMRGQALHPLNKLKAEHPDLYMKKSAKYEDRKHVMEQFIPTLAASWNDVLHFTAVNPSELKQALVEAGYTPGEMKFYQVDPALLDPAKTTVYLYQDKSHDDKMHPHNFEAFDPENLETHTTIPETTKRYYKTMFTESKKPLLFVGVPHILHKGSIDVSDLAVITV
jgi:hypothetical protein